MNEQNLARNGTRSSGRKFSSKNLICTQIRKKIFVQDLAILPDLCAIPSIRVIGKFSLVTGVPLNSEGHFTMPRFQCAHCTKKKDAPRNRYCKCGCPSDPSLEFLRDGIPQHFVCGACYAGRNRRKCIRPVYTPEPGDNDST